MTPNHRILSNRLIVTNNKAVFDIMNQDEEQDAYQPLSNLLNIK